MAEETGLQLQPSSLIGVYVQPGGILFVFHVMCGRDTTLLPGADIVGCEWPSVDRAMSLPEADVIQRTRLTVVLLDFSSGRRFPLEAVRTVGY